MCLGTTSFHHQKKVQLKFKAKVFPACVQGTFEFKDLRFELPPAGFLLKRRALSLSSRALTAPVLLDRRVSSTKFKIMAANKGEYSRLSRINGFVGAMVYFSNPNA